MIVKELGGPSALVRQEQADLEPGPGEVCVDVKAIGCNFFDTLITQGKYQVQPDLPFAPGAEAAGVVRAVGQGVEGVAAGDRVSVLLSYGTFASMLVAPAERVFPMAEAMSFEYAAALEALDAALDLPLQEGMAKERSCYERTLVSEDRLEALAAFAEKRPPVFKGR